MHNTLAVTKRLFTAFLIASFLGVTLGAVGTSSAQARPAQQTVTGLAKIADTYMSKAVVVGNQVFYPYDDSVHGSELWKMDGATDGTALVKDITPNPNIGTPLQLLFALNNLLIFMDGYYPPVLYRSDGTDAGTFPISNSGAGGVVQAGNQLFFAIQDQLWTSDGTTTQLVKDVSPDTSYHCCMSLFYSAGTVYFDADNADHTAIDLWKSDGTGPGTQIVASFPGLSVSIDSLSNFTDVNGEIFFIASKYIPTGTQLWKTDGTAGGTTMVLDLMAANLYLRSGLTNLNGNLLFWVAPGGVNPQLWKSDGTALGTSMVKEVALSVGTVGDPARMATFQGQLFFSDANGALWSTDGTTAGTINLGQTATTLTTSAGNLYFYDGSHLGQTDGSLAGTTIITDQLAGSGMRCDDRFLDFQGSLLIGCNATNSNNAKEDGIWQVLTGDAPTVLQVTDGQQVLNNNGVVSGPISELVLTFSQDVANPAGDSDAVDVTNPNSYAVDPGAIASVAYTNNGGAGPFVATLHFSSPLTVSFNFKVLGAGIAGLNGLHLAGDGQMAYSDFVLQVYIPGYTVVYPVPADSTAAIVESTETSGKGGSFMRLGPLGRYVMVGDTRLDRQIRSILYFENLQFGLNNQVVVSATLRFQASAIVGTNPYPKFGKLVLDIKPFNGYSEKVSDFQAPAPFSAAATFTKLPGGWYSATITNPVVLQFALSPYKIEFRLRFTRDDNDNGRADYIIIKTTAVQLIIGNYLK